MFDLFEIRNMHKDKSFCGLWSHVCTGSCADWYWSFPSAFVFAEGLHSWDPSGPLGQSGYTAMLGNSPHINQPGSFSAINAQDRMVWLLNVLKVLEKGLNFRSSNHCVCLYRTTLCMVRTSMVSIRAPQPIATHPPWMDQTAFCVNYLHHFNLMSSRLWNELVIEFRLDLKVDSSCEINFGLRLVWTWTIIEEMAFNLSFRFWMVIFSGLANYGSTEETWHWCNKWS